MKKLLAVVVFAVIIAGCVGQEDTITYGENIIIVKDEKVLPSPVTAGSSFDVSFIAQNVHETEDANNVLITLYDWGPAACKVTSVGGAGVGEETFYTLLSESRVPSGAERLVEIGAKAPSQAEIAGIRSRCDFKYNVMYDSFAVTTIDTSVISEARLKQLQKAGETVSFSPTQTIGAGPIQIKFEHAVSLPVREGDSLIFDVKVEDVGEGNYISIPVDTLEVTVPEEFIPVEEGCSIEFVGNVENGKRVYRNKEPLPLIRGSTSKYRCKFTAPSVLEERTFFITGRMDYTYVIYKEISVDIIP
ncbi:MAG: hypothetical protein ACE5J7_01155 [Candidatus Aenigmatarchaeota archaeon]